MIPGVYLFGQYPLLTIFLDNYPPEVSPVLTSYLVRMQSDNVSDDCNESNVYFGRE